jgi:hypothetical protein
MSITCALFWGVKQRLVAILYRRFGTTYRSHFQGSKSVIKQLHCTSWPFKMGPIRRPETSVKDYHSTLLNTPEERRSHRDVRAGTYTSYVVLGMSIFQKWYQLVWLFRGFTQTLKRNADTVVDIGKERLISNPNILTIHNYLLPYIPFAAETALSNTLTTTP